MMLDQISHNKGEVCLCKMSVLVHKNETAPTGFISDFEKSLGRVLSKEFNKHAKNAVKAAMKVYQGKETKKQVAQVMKAIDIQMDKFGSASLIKTVEQSLGVFYEEVTGRFIRQHKLREATEKAARPKGQLAIDFNQVDQDAVKATQRMTVQTAGKYYPDQLRNKTNEVVSEVILEKGLPIEAAAARLEAEIAGSLGVKDAASVVPSRFATNPQHYFQIVASNASVTSTSLGRMIAMSDAGVEKYRISAIIDNRTSDICMALNGQEFAVGKTMGAVEKFMGISDFSQLDEDFAFTKDNSVPKWAESGLGFPPYHHLCRTTVVPVF